MWAMLVEQKRSGGRVGLFRMRQRKKNVCVEGLAHVDYDTGKKMSMCPCG